MRTNIDIDDAVLQAAMRGSEFKTKKEAVEAGLKLLARQAHYREVLKWRGKLHWDDQPDPLAASVNRVMEKAVPYGVKSPSTQKAAPSKNASPKTVARTKRKVAEAT
ncbi:MAG: type II toxin-antitoxin system VapB family antitoxin [Brachymonas sp.]|nr:type II toxin-antitoxin system VapB family antitoxin [Brachymonas sp.]